MRTNRILVVSTILAVSLSACVSKKKYVEMESSKMRAEQRVRELTDENEAKDSRIAKMIADYESMKKDLMTSNAEKDQQIGDLQGQINSLKSNVQEKDATIEEKLYAFEFEKRQMKEALDKSQGASTDLQTRNTNLSNELTSTKNELSDLKFSYEKEQANAESLNRQLEQKSGLYEAQMQQIASLKADIQKLKVEGQEKDETIERLKNNVTLLKNEIGKQ
ncbi:hypothetical protein [Mangrovibacterium diazotrophicum]|uniref:Uncharacterized protein n=1 Tax=Mangrovibacterium diazotrophicum TaxID=1261403 RepID=A0A419WAG9_9BACT|nr:hypothetical protein [Mangrovibacterium diazotrophicum]RKD92470.1 hypothetical protein BC643_2843 [Mangrovibacterium diazotrophicum]